MIEKNLAVGKFVNFIEPRVQLHVDPGTFKSMSQVVFLGNSSCQWLHYFPGVITETALGQDVMSGPFCGCFLVVYKKNGKIYVGHIGTDVAGSDNTMRVKKTWKDFADQASVSDLLVAYNPLRQWEMIKGQGRYPGPRGNDALPHPFAPLYAVVTSAHQCYVMWLWDQEGNPTKRRIAGLQRITPSHHKAGLRTLFS